MKIIRAAGVLILENNGNLYAEMASVHNYMIDFEFSM